MPTRNVRGRFQPTNPVDIRSEDTIPELENLITTGPITFVLIYADWCGHCVNYKPTWNKYAKTPGRKANIASVHYDMKDKIPAIKNAKIEGYPSVIEVEPSGKIREYRAPGSTASTNAIPFMRDEKAMKEALTVAAATAKASPADSAEPGPQAGIKNVHESLELAKSIETPQKGGSMSVIGSIVNALQKVGPAAVLLAAHAMLPKRPTKTYKSPKRHSRRASTRKSRRV